MRSAVIGPFAVRRRHAQFGRILCDRQVAFRLADRVVLRKRAFLQRVAECVLYGPLLGDRSGILVGRAFASYPPGLFRQAVIVLAFDFCVRQRAAVVLSRLAAARQSDRLRVNRQRANLVLSLRVVRFMRYTPGEAVRAAVAYVLDAVRALFGRYYGQGIARAQLELYLTFRSFDRLLAIGHLIHLIRMRARVVVPCLVLRLDRQLLVSLLYRQLARRLLDNIIGNNSILIRDCRIGGEGAGIGRTGYCHAFGAGVVQSGDRVTAQQTFDLYSIFYAGAITILSLSVVRQGLIFNGNRQWQGIVDFDNVVPVRDRDGLRRINAINCKVLFLIGRFRGCGIGGRNDLVRNRVRLEGGRCAEEIVLHGDSHLIQLKVQLELGGAVGTEDRAFHVRGLAVVHVLAFLFGRLISIGHGDGRAGVAGARIGGFRGRLGIGAVLILIVVLDDIVCFGLGVREADLSGGSSRRQGEGSRFGRRIVPIHISLFHGIRIQPRLAAHGQIGHDDALRTTRQRRGFILQTVGGDGEGRRRRFVGGGLIPGLVDGHLAIGLLDRQVGRFIGDIVVIFGLLIRRMIERDRCGRRHNLVCIDLDICLLAAERDPCQRIAADKAVDGHIGSKVRSISTLRALRSVVEIILLRQRGNGEWGLVDGQVAGIEVLSLIEPCNILTIGIDDRIALGKGAGGRVCIDTRGGRVGDGQNIVFTKPLYFVILSLDGFTSPSDGAGEGVAGLGGAIIGGGLILHGDREGGGGDRQFAEVFGHGVVAGLGGVGVAVRRPGDGIVIFAFAHLGLAAGGLEAIGFTIDDAGHRIPIRLSQRGAVIGLAGAAGGDGYGLGFDFQATGTDIDGNAVVVVLREVGLGQGYGVGIIARILLGDDIVVLTVGGGIICRLPVDLCPDIIQIGCAIRCCLTAVARIGDHHIIRDPLAPVREARLTWLTVVGFTGPAVGLDADGDVDLGDFQGAADVADAVIVARASLTIPVGNHRVLRGDGGGACVQAALDDIRVGIVIAKTGQTIAIQQALHLHLIRQ